MKTHFITFLLLVGMSLGISSRLHAQSSYQPGEENLKAREEFQDNKFGIFLHWGLYAMLATGIIKSMPNWQAVSIPPSLMRISGWLPSKHRELNISV